MEQDAGSYVLNYALRPHELRILRDAVKDRIILQGYKPGAAYGETAFGPWLRDGSYCNEAFKIGRCHRY